jgi:5-methylcytosine-specific restriction endonuclease McrA
MSGYNFQQKEWGQYPLDNCIVGRMVVDALEKAKSIVQLEGWYSNVPSKYSLVFDELDWEQLTDPSGKLNDVMFMSFFRGKKGSHAFYDILGFESEFMHVDPSWSMRFDFDERRAESGARKILVRYLCLMFMGLIDSEMEQEYRQSQKIIKQQRIERQKEMIRVRSEYEIEHPEEADKIKLTLRFAILLRDKFRCRYCGRDASEVKLQVDHIIPKKEGGGNDPSNLITACFDCNQGKKARLFLSDKKGILSRSKQGQIPSSIMFMGLSGSSK